MKVGKILDTTGKVGTSGRSETSEAGTMEPTMGSGTEPGSEVKVLGSVVQIDEGKLQAHLDEVVRSTVEEWKRH